MTATTQIYTYCHTLSLHDALPLGTVVALPDDSTMDLVTAFTGSGPAFVFRLIESYAAAGERLGLSAEDALNPATATFGGATALLADSGGKPGVPDRSEGSRGGKEGVR